MANCIRCGRKLPPFTWKKVCSWCKQHEAAQHSDADDNVQQRVMPAPWVRRGESTITLTHVLFGANVAVFLAMLLAGGSIEDFSGQLLVHFGGNFGPLTLSGDWWRLLTYMFVHGGILHIGFNMWCLWDLGALCESLYGRWTYALIYLITGVAAGIASLAWNPGVLSVGASGAIFGLAGALIASFYLGEFSLPQVAIKGTLRSLLFFAVFNIFFGFMIPHIDNACHVGGLVSGLILGALIARVAPHHELLLRRLGVLCVVGLAVVAAGFGVQRWRGAPFQLGRALESLSQSQPDRALKQLQSLVNRQPGSPDAHFALAQALFRQGQLSQAESEFKRVLELEPQNDAAHFDLGLTYLNENRPDEAKVVFTQMLAQDSNSSRAHYGIGLSLADQGQPRAALDEFKVAVKLDPQISGVYYEMGRCYSQLRMYDDAVKAYQQEKEQSGDDPDLESALAEAYQAKGMTKEAQDAMSKAAALRGGKQN
ncbi:MAG TPA: rhomboid family intramembrane serine protease [Verrucomicrobiae bacterium]|nr:rhomboid family intramembrane serine protease [Verrucomicrobiae bacterium]